MYIYILFILNLNTIDKNEILTNKSMHKMYMLESKKLDGKNKETLKK